MRQGPGGGGWRHPSPPPGPRRARARPSPDRAARRRAPTWRPRRHRHRAGATSRRARPVRCSPVRCRRGSQPAPRRPAPGSPSWWGRPSWWSWGPPWWWSWEQPWWTWSAAAARGRSCRRRRPGSRRGWRGRRRRRWSGLAAGAAEHLHHPELPVGVDDADSDLGEAGAQDVGAVGPGTHEQPVHVVDGAASSDVLGDLRPATHLGGEVGVVVQLAAIGHSLGVTAGHRLEIAPHGQAGETSAGALLVDPGDEAALCAGVLGAAGGSDRNEGQQADEERGRATTESDDGARVRRGPPRVLHRRGYRPVTWAGWR